MIVFITVVLIKDNFEDFGYYTNNMRITVRYVEVIEANLNMRDKEKNLLDR